MEGFSSLIDTMLKMLAVMYANNLVTKEQHDLIINREISLVDMLVYLETK